MLYNYNDNIPPEIRAELLKYKLHRFVHCLHCGYNGKMGVVKKIWPWFLQWWFIIITAVIFGFGFILCFLRGFTSKAGPFIIKCPNCQVETKTDF